MDSPSSFLEDILRLSKLTKNVSNIRDLEENLNNLKRKRDTLDDLHKDVKEKVELEERQRRRRTNQVRSWLRNVEALNKQVGDIIVEGGNQELRKKLLGIYYSPKTCWFRYNLGKQVNERQSSLEELIDAGRLLNDIAYSPAIAPLIEEIPVESTVGFDSIFKEIWSRVEDGNMGVIGLYGMGGVGKTTLLKRINNEFHRTGHSYELVDWVVISKQGDPAEKIQRAIWKKMELPKGELEDIDCGDERAAKILSIMKQKKFLLFLDDIWEGINLSELGIPPCGGPENQSKIIFTTRFEDVCDRMNAKKIRIECLSPDKALKLFMKMIGKEHDRLDHEVVELAKTMAEKCSGLPLALKTVGRAMVSKRSPQEWKHAVDVLKTAPQSISGMEAKVFALLKFSYDNLADETQKRCFLYCSLYPKDHHINKDLVIDLWIGKGLFRDVHEADAARNYGMDIIACLTRACLLEDDPLSKYHIKMRGVVRDMALWISSNDERKSKKVMVQEDLRLAI